MSIYRQAPPQPPCLPPLPPDPLIWERELAAAKKPYQLSVPDLRQALHWSAIGAWLLAWACVARVVVWIWML